MDDSDFRHDMHRLWRMMSINQSAFENYPYAVNTARFYCKLIEKHLFCKYVSSKG